jgi:hypothetical protein
MEPEIGRGFDYTDIFVKNKKKSVLIREIRVQMLFICPGGNLS